MGYSHYWYRSVDPIDASTWAAIVADCRKVCDALAIPLGDAHGHGVAEFSADRIAFNGHVDSGALMPQSARVDGLTRPSAGAEGVTGWSGQPTTAGAWCGGPCVSTRTLPDDGDGSFESFVFTRAAAAACFDSCKTNYRPYDLAVQCCLIVVDMHLSSWVAVQSDGDAAAWQEASDICQHVLGYGLNFSLAADDVADRLRHAWTLADCARLEEARAKQFAHYPPRPKNINEAIARIRTALRARTGKAWSVRKDTFCGIAIDAPPKARTWHFGELRDDGGERIEYCDAAKQFGHISPADRQLLAGALALRNIRPGRGVSVSASGDHYTEYVDRAEGRTPRVIGQSQWD